MTMRPVSSLGVETLQKRCGETVRHAPDCVALNRAEAAYNANQPQAWRGWLTDIRRKACCRNLPPGDPAVCGWSGALEVELTGGSQDVVEAQLWQCPRCGTDHVDEVSHR
jgi:uncharacterized C2H2 Zn-finger protein